MDEETAVNRLTFVVTLTALSAASDIVKLCGIEESERTRNAGSREYSAFHLLLGGRKVTLWTGTGETDSPHIRLSTDFRKNS